MKGQVTIGAIFATVVLFIVLVSIAPIFYTGIVGGWASLSIAEKGLGVLLVPFLFFVVLSIPFIRHEIMGDRRRFG
jgi:hypothetical protein